jgi:predicted outer membrane lipoprotein
MRINWAAMAGACLLGAALFCAFGVAPARALTAVEERDLALEEANAANALAVTIRAALNPERCLTGAQALEAIQGATSGARIQTIASALGMVGEDRWWCESVRSALGAADQAAQLALATSVDGPTGAVRPGPAAVSTFFGFGAVGAPGGGGGSGYLP